MKTPLRFLCTIAALVYSVTVFQIQAEEPVSPPPGATAASKEKKAKPEKTEAKEKKAPVRVRGEVTQINQEGKSILLSTKGKESGSATVVWSAGTKFKKEKADAVLADVVVGSNLIVVLAEDGTAKIITITAPQEKKVKKEKQKPAPTE